MQTGIVINFVSFGLSIQSDTVTKAEAVMGSML